MKVIRVAKEKTQANQEREHNKEVSKAYRFFNSPVPIIVVLILFSIGLMFYSRYLINSTHLYTFSGIGDDFWFSNGTIYISRNLNYFGDSKVKYTGKDMKLYNFEVGFYVKEDSTYREVSIMSGYDVKDDDGNKLGASLVELLESTDFSFTETHNSDTLYLSDRNIKNLENLVFRVKGQDEKDNEIDIVVPLDVEKISK